MKGLSALVAGAILVCLTVLVIGGTIAALRWMLG